VLDLTGSENGKWSEPTTPGTLSSVKVRVLVSHFESWTVSAAVLGASDEHFVALETVVVRTVKVELEVTLL